MNGKIVYRIDASVNNDHFREIGTGVFEVTNLDTVPQLNELFETSDVSGMLGSDLVRLRYVRIH